MRSLERTVYNAVRRSKAYFLERPPTPLSYAFFMALGVADRLVSQRPQANQNSPDTIAWRDSYAGKYGVAPLYRVETDAPVAIHSDDHKIPRGTINDNSRNPRFNRRVYQYFNGRKDLRIMDMGCSGGGLVRSFIEDGHEAIGVEGSDASKRLGSGEWRNIPLHLFTADISKPFRVLTADRQQVTFDCITAWEVLEHIPEDALPALLENIRSHLAPGGIFIGSVDMVPDGNHITGANYHVCLHDQAWWQMQFAKAGLCEVTPHPFEVEDFVRGHGMGLRDWDPRDGTGFHTILTAA